MADNKSRRALVQGWDEFAERVGQTAVNLGRELDRLQRQPPVLPERDTVSDQADGTRGPEQIICSKSKPCPACQKNRETGRLSTRGRTKTRG